MKRARAAVAALRVAVLVVLVAGVRAGRPSVVVNAALALAVTALPVLLERRTDVRVSPRATLVVATAVFLHALGMTWGYESVWWWDHLTHTLSAAVVASVAGVAARSLEARTEALYLPGAALAGYLVVFTLAAGVVWELLEALARYVGTALGAEPLLMVYGIGDTVFDLVFDAVGAVAVGAWGHLRERSSRGRT